MFMFAEGGRKTLRGGGKGQDFSLCLGKSKKKGGGKKKEREKKTPLGCSLGEG